MASDLVQQLVESGIHFGHKASRWNPKMKPYIYGKQNSVHLIDIKQTIKGLLAARKFVAQVVGRGQDILFVGTKRQARHAVQSHAERCGMHFVIERWLGGTLTNFRTIRSRLSRLEELEQVEKTGQLQTESKKTQSRLKREHKKIFRNLCGIRKMTKLPGALVIIDARVEHNAINEAKKLNIPTICLLDTDSDPDVVSIPIPGNDDAMRAIELVVSTLADAVEEAKRARPVAGEQVASNAPQARKRSRRPSTSQMTEQPENWSETSDEASSVVTSSTVTREAIAAVADASATTTHQ